GGSGKSASGDRAPIEATDCAKYLRGLRAARPLGESQTERAPLPGAFAHRLEAAVVVLHDAVADRQSQPGSLGAGLVLFGRKERIEDVVQHLGGHAAAVVLTGD